MKKLILETLPSKYYVCENGQIINDYNKVLKPFKLNSGYLCIDLYKNKTKHKFLVHRLVAKYFVKGYSDGLQVHHKDHNKLNNIATNLEWVTPKENIYRNIEDGKLNTYKAREALKARRNTPIYQIDKETNRIIKKYNSIKQASLENNISNGQLSNYLHNKPIIRNGKKYYQKTCGGYVWKFVDPSYDNGTKRKNITLKNINSNKEYTFDSMRKASLILKINYDKLARNIRLGKNKCDEWLILR